MSRTHARVASLLVPCMLASRLAGAGDVPAITPSELPASGRQVAVVSAPSFGRYALLASSSQGTALQLVDRMAGPGEVHGVPGETDGRVDAFLDRGETRVVALSHERGAGRVRLEARAFEERSPVPFSALVELRQEDATLGDFEQRSWWLHLPEPRAIALEAAGRHLADLRLWKDGTWLVAAEPAREVVQPREGRPLLACRLAARLPAGTYLVSAYGGPSQPWSDDDGSRPLHVRLGVPTLAEAGRARFTVGPFGVERFVVPGSATYVRAELPEARPATLGVAGWDEDAPFKAELDSSASIEKDSRVPAAALELPLGDSPRLLTVRGEDGQPFVLQHFEARDRYPLPGPGDYWISAVNSGPPDDSLASTAFLTRIETRGDRTHVVPVAAAAVLLDSAHSWARRFNLLEESTLFLDVREAGRYEVSLGGGARARCRIEPFLLERPEGYEPPALQGDGSGWELDPGYWVLTLVPEKQGILEAAVARAGLLDKVKGLVGAGPQSNVSPGPSQARLGVVRVPDSCIVWTNHVGERRTGLVVRRVPLDLADALPLVLAPGESVEVPFASEAPVVLRARAEDGTLVPVAVDGGQAAPAQRVEPGRHSAGLTWSGAGSVVLSLAASPVTREPDTPAPPPPEALAGPPDLPVLAEGAQRHLDLAAESSATYAVRAEAPALYRIESTGLLATRGDLRLRTIPSFASSAEGGTGRNFLLQHYLREGDYQVTVTATGASAGRLGLSLSRTPVRDGGELAPGVRARATLAAGEGLAYRIRIPEGGEWSLRSLGLGRQFACRLEDADGWPLVAPGGPADFRRRFDPGEYRLVLLPAPASARVVTLLEPLADPPAREGHGPFPLPLGRSVEHVWREPERGEERAPDRFDLELPADADVALSLSNEMQGELWRVDEHGVQSRAGAVPPGGTKELSLAAGRYRLDATCSRRNSGQAYRVLAAPAQLVAGTSREVTAPARIEVAAGANGRLTLSSWGGDDVRARLLDSAGRLVAANDDAPDDWNFRLSTRLAPGRYTLHVDPVGAGSGSTTVTASAPTEREEARATLPFSTTLPAAGVARVLPLEVPSDATVLAVQADSSDALLLELEALRDDAWTTCGSATGRSPWLAIPLSAGGGAHRLRIEPLEANGAPVLLRAATAAPAPASESRWTKGLRLAPLAGTELAIAVVRPESPGLLRVSDPETTWVASASGRAAERPVNGLAPARGDAILVARPVAAGATSRASRVVLGTEGSRSVTLSVRRGEPVACDLARAAGAPLAVIATTMAGQPGVAIEDAPSSLDGGVTATTLAAWERGAASLALDARRPVAVAWVADGSERLEVRLEAPSLAAPGKVEQGGDRWEDTIPAGEARLLDLAKGPGREPRLRLVLSAGTLAAALDAGRATSVHGAGPDAACDESAVVRGGALLVVAAGRGASSASVRTEAPGAAAPELAPGAAWEGSRLAAGSLRVALAPQRGMTPPTRTLHVRGADARLLGADGSIADGRDLRVPAAGGVVELRGAPGPLLAWVDDEVEGEAPWDRDEPGQAQAVRSPSRVPLAGESVRLVLEDPSPRLVHARVAEPVVTRLVLPGGLARTEAHPRGARLDFYLPAGRAELWVRPFAGAELATQLEVSSSAVALAGEGLGPEVLLGAGDARAFAFDVARAAAIGVGVRSESGGVTCALLDASGSLLGEGVVVMAEVQPGRHVLVLRSPPDAAPARARPALVGLSPPGEGPPADVIQQYVEGGELAPPLSEGEVAPGYEARNVGSGESSEWGGD